jgi:spore germination protein KA
VSDAVATNSNRFFSHTFYALGKDNPEDGKVGESMHRRRSKKADKQKQTLPSPPEGTPSDSVTENVSYVEERLFFSSDLKKRPIDFQGEKGFLLYLESMTDRNQIETGIIKQVKQSQDQDVPSFLDAMIAQERQSHTDLNSAINQLMMGHTLALFPGGRVYTVGSTVSHNRNIREPDNESVVRGAHDSLVEELVINLYQIRRRIENPNLTVRYFELGKETRTRVAMVYMRNLASPSVVDQVAIRLKDISVDMILSPGFLQEFTEDNPWSPFPQALNTERPDRVYANLMEGRVVLMADGDPTALVIPVTFFAFYQSPDDYHSRWIVGSFVRMIRLVSFLIAFLLPSLYIASVSYHPEILPTQLIFTIKSTLERIPFPPLLEALLMELTIELIREAGIRLPSRVGQTIGIVGGLVIGDAVVRAGLVSFTMIIVVALTAIASFVVPSNEMSIAVRLLRFPLMLSAATFGLVGISFGLMILFMHLTKLESFGTPYFSPVSPLRLKDLKDTFIRFPIWLLNQRPHDAQPQRYPQEDLSREWKRRDDSSE